MLAVWNNPNAALWSDKMNKYIGCEWWELRGGAGRRWGQEFWPGWVFWEQNNFQGHGGWGDIIFIYFFFFSRCCYAVGLPADAETKFYCLRWEREEILTPNGWINAPGTWEESCSQYSHKWVNKGRYFRFPRVQNPAIEFSKSWGSSCQLFSNFPSSFSLLYILLSYIWSLHTLFYSSEDKINKDKSISGMSTQLLVCTDTAASVEAG